MTEKTFRSDAILQAVQFHCQPSRHSMYRLFMLPIIPCNGEWQYCDYVTHYNMAHRHTVQQNGTFSPRSANKQLSHNVTSLGLLCGRTSYINCSSFLIFQSKGICNRLVTLTHVTTSPVLYYDVLSEDGPVTSDTFMSWRVVTLLRF
jgi:hypothetical protein